MSLALGFIHGVGGSVVDPEGDRYPDPFSWILFIRVFNNIQIYISKNSSFKY
jgi:hypothetical protein